ncbi:MAG: DUF167 domain-containing protein [Candidatus Omnitrophica bacterium]|nr:DUF167 domain-containing protein [Candidatus Omnitrophota bacterium]
MKIFVTVKPNAKENRLEKIDETHFKALVKAPPKEGKANQAVIQLLSEYFKLPKLCFSLVSGETSRTKAFKLS